MIRLAKVGGLLHLRVRFCLFVWGFARTLLAVAAHEIVLVHFSLGVCEAGTYHVTRTSLRGQTMATGHPLNGPFTTSVTHSPLGLDRASSLSQPFWMQLDRIKLIDIVSLQDIFIPSALKRFKDP